MKYNYARTINTIDGEERFEAVECASFDEAQKYVEKGIYDRALQLKERMPKEPAPPVASFPSAAVPTLGGSTIGTHAPTSGMENTTTHQGQH